MNKYFQLISQHFSISTEEVLSDHRIRVALETGGIATTLMGASWALLFSYLKNWPLVLIDFLIIFVGLATLVLLKKRFLRSASAVLLSGLFGLAFSITLLMDTPSLANPRVMHLYFLSLAFYAYLLLGNEKLWLRNTVIVFFLCIFLIFSSTNLSVANSLVIPESVRHIGAWINSATAISLLCLVLHIMQSDFILRTQIGNELSQALWENQFELYYQPQVNAQGVVFGSEALIRWNHPIRGVVSPAEFIPHAESIGLMNPIGLWVLNESCKQLSIWKNDAKMAHLSISINVSAHQFYDQELVSKVLSIVKRMEIDPKLLKLELTEGILIQNIDEVISKMHALKAAGIGISLDDFGTGYSSLSYLKRLPLDQLKIDQSFIKDILNNPHDQAIAKTIISLGRDLGLNVIAEGVECQQQQTFLLASDCNAFQGYWFSPPVPVHLFRQFVAHNQRSQRE